MEVVQMERARKELIKEYQHRRETVPEPAVAEALVEVVAAVAVVEDKQ
jgi:hypothetical protein